MFREYIMKGKGLALIQSVIRQQLKADPTIVEGAGWTRMCRSFELYDLIQDRPHQFITIALPIDYDIKRLKKQLSKTWCKWSSGAKCVVERYSKSGDNLHLHVLKEKIYSKTKIIRDVSRKFKIEKNFVDVRSSTKIQDYNNRSKYIEGTKSDEEKCMNVDKDKEWRHQNDIEEIYYL